MFTPAKVEVKDKPVGAASPIAPQFVKPQVFAPHPALISFTIETLATVVFKDIPLGIPAWFCNLPNSPNPQEPAPNPVEGVDASSPKVKVNC